MRLSRICRLRWRSGGTTDFIVRFNVQLDFFASQGTNSNPKLLLAMGG